MNIFTIAFCYQFLILYHVISARTSLHITTFKDHEGASVGGLGGLTGYKCKTCLGTGKPWSGLGSYNL